MASFSRAIVLLLTLLLNFSPLCIATRRLTALYQPPAIPLTYHRGAVLRGNIPISVLWYGRFAPAQKSIISDFLLSLTKIPQSPSPSVSQWWNTINSLYLSKTSGAKFGQKNSNILLSNQTTDAKCSMGKSLTSVQIAALAAKARPKKGGIVLVLTAQDIAVQGFCMSRCGMHGTLTKTGSTFVWVGNSATQCPGQCAWPFHQPIYGPQTPPLIAPNGDVGIDGMIINISSMIAGAVTNPSGDGFYQGPKEAPLEAATACPGIYGKGAFPGYPGHLLVDPSTGASFNANGARGRKYMLPALFDPATSSCSTLV
ncbi:protein PHOSPHATE-INDUCED 1-like [Carex rostrata]